MAPCRSHHGNHTRQEWIIIWSVRNWILKHANQPRSLDLCRYVYTGPGGVSSVATDPPGTPVAPCIIFNLELERERTKEEKEREEVLHLFRCYTHTHTHPAGAGSTLKGKRKKKADTRRANGQKQRRGGRGTDGPPEPTYTAKRTWTKQRTHLNPTTHYGEARGEN